MWWVGGWLVGGWVVVRGVVGDFSISSWCSVVGGCEKRWDLEKI